MSTRFPEAPARHPHQMSRPHPGRLERLKRTVGLACRTPAALAFVGKSIRAAGPDASLEELEALGLARCSPLTLLNVFRRALRNNDMQQARAAQNALSKHPVGLPVRYPQDIPFMRWRTGGPTSPGRFLFVSGVARSGTTALGRLLGSHEDVAMYTELYLPRYGYVPEMLAPENVYMLAEKGLLGLNERNALVLGKSAQCGVVGDKRPGFLVSAELSLANFARHQMKVVHLVRNIYDVAASYQRKFEAGMWNKDFCTAVDESNLSNRLVLSFLTGEYRNSFVIVDYDRFWYSAKNLRALFRRVQLDDTVVGEGNIESFVQVAQTRLAAGQFRLTAEQRRYIDRKYDFSREQELKRATPAELAQSREDSLPAASQ
jgi:hypothetical protein